MTTLSRRDFFTSSAERLALLVLASRAAACKRYEGDGKLRVLSLRQTATLLALAQVLVPPTEAVGVTVEETDLVLRVDQFLARADGLATRQFGQLLTALEFYPQFFSRHFGRFSALPAPAREEVVRSFAESRFFVKRSIFTALKSVVVNHYYSSERVQAVLGYAPACRW